MSKPILCLDFDGVCSDYSSGWQGMGNIPDAPVPGLFEFILDAAHYFDIQVYSSRSAWPEGLTAMKVWFAKHYSAWLNSLDGNGLDNAYNKAITINKLISFPNHKPPAAISLDDRAVQFNGIWPSMEFLVKFKPWTNGADNMASYVKYKQELADGNIS